MDEPRETGAWRRLRLADPRDENEREGAAGATFARWRALSNAVLPIFPVSGGGADPRLRLPLVRGADCLVTLGRAGALEPPAPRWRSVSNADWPPAFPVTGGGESPWFVAGVSLWLWFTVLFANFAEAMAEGRGKAQADALKATRQNVTAKKLLESPVNLKVVPDFPYLVKGGEATFVPAPDLREGDIVLVQAGDQIPGDGEVNQGDSWRRYYRRAAPALTPGL